MRVPGLSVPASAALSGAPAGLLERVTGLARVQSVLAAEPRVRAAVLGLGGAPASAEVAGQITVRVEFLVQWDNERVPRAQSLALFEALASAEKTLHANPGRHGEVPAFEVDSTLRFFARHLG